MNEWKSLLESLLNALRNSQGSAVRIVGIGPYNIYLVTNNTVVSTYTLEMIHFTDL